MNPPTTHQSLLLWVEHIQRLCKPDAVEWCDGSEEEWNRLCGLLVERGTFTRLDPEKRPNSFLARSAPSDVARVEDRTFICTRRQGEAGPNNNWAHPDAMRKTLLKRFHRSMRGRTLYIVPFCMGPPDSPLSIIGIQATDSPYVVVSMRIMAHMGSRVLERLGDSGPFMCRACTASGARWTRARPTCPGRATTRNSSSIFPTSGPSGPTAAATAETHC